MSAFKGTPGPWEVVENPDSGGGDTVISNAASIYSDDETYVADVYRGCVGSESVTHNQQIANARLIAAAPELLDTVEELLLEIDRSMPHCTDAMQRIPSDSLRRARSAIAKATGGAA